MHLTPAMGVALVALFVAVSGGAYAATTRSSAAIVACVHHAGGGLYIAASARPTTSSSSGTPPAHRPAGKDGGAAAVGPKGDTGPAGPKGDAGAVGPAGPFPKVLPSEITVRGSWAAGGQAGGGTAYGSISFGFTFASAPTFHYVGGPASVHTGCTGGTSSNPTADPGNLCFYSNGFPDQHARRCGHRRCEHRGTLFTVSSINNNIFADGGPGLRRRPSRLEAPRPQTLLR